MLSKEEIKRMTGQQTGERSPAYKLNEVTMSGDDGSFRMRQVLSKKGEDGRYPTKDLGKELHGVFLKMRWRFFRFEEDTQSLSSTEYDNKNTDQITVFPSKEKGLAFAMKEKYGLSTQRVVYLYMPSEKQIVRLIVKASALSGDKNPNKEFGLFEYIDDLNSTEALMHEYITTATGVHRADPKGNKRKDYVAMTFKVGRVLTNTEKTKVESLIQEVHEKTTGAKESIKDASDHATEALDAVVDGSDPDLITFE